MKKTLQQKRFGIFDQKIMTIHLVSFWAYCLCNVPLLVSYILLTHGKEFIEEYNWAYSVDMVCSLISQIILVVLCKQICNRSL
jgi:hypothetical protein